VLLTLAALGARLVMAPWFRPGATGYSTYTIAIIVSAWLGGLGPGLACTVLSVIVVDFSHIEPVHSLAVARKPDAFMLTLFALSGVMISVLSESLHRSRRRAEAQAAALEREIAEGRRTKSELAESQADLEALFKLAGAGLHLLHPESNRFLRVNDRLVELTGYSREELSQMTALELSHPDDVASSLEALARLKSGAVPSLRLEKRFRRKDGSEVWVQVLGTPVRDAAGALRRLIGVVIDLTAQKEAEAALWESDRRKDEFLAMLAHELRNPLGAIQHALDAWTEDVDNRQTLDWVRQVALRQTGQLRRLTDDLLDVGRISQGKIHLRQKRIDLASILDGAIEAARPMIEERKHTLTRSYVSGLLPVDGDPVRLQQIAENLITNAAKYTEPGGRIEVIGERVGDNAVFHVRDNGLGIPPERIPEMFELFSQGDRSLARSEGGLGLGLTIVRKLTEMHGGIVTAKSDGPGCGSEFTVQIPLALTPAGDAPVESNTPSARGSASRRIMIVDDNVDAAAGLERLLKRRGFSIAIAYDGVTALQRAAEIHPEIVLLDIGLPGMDGYEVARQLRERNSDGTASPMLVAITGYGQEQDRQKSLDAGFQHHLTKPVDLDDLERCLRTDADGND
jgi:PAS domain S-box-containing protein